MNQLPVGSWVEWFDFYTGKLLWGQITSYNGQEMYRVLSDRGMYESVRVSDSKTLSKKDVVKRVLKR